MTEVQNGAQLDGMDLGAVTAPIHIPQQHRSDSDRTPAPLFAPSIPPESPMPPRPTPHPRTASGTPMVPLQQVAGQPLSQSVPQPGPELPREPLSAAARRGVMIAALGLGLVTVVVGLLALTGLAPATAGVAALVVGALALVLGLFSRRAPVDSAP